MRNGKISYRDLRADSWQSYVEQAEQMEKSMKALNDQTECGKPGARSIPGLSCAKCGRPFQSPSEYRFRGADGKAICRNERACREWAERE